MTSGEASNVSVIVPVYNSARYVGELLDALAAQDIGSGNFDVILVNDGSTDDSGALLDAYCASHPGFRVIHQQNTGRPGPPRNTGLRVTTAKYVLFVDSDDLLAPSCLSALVSFADEHGSDIVIPRMAPLGRRSFPTKVYEKTRIDTDLPTAFKTLFAQKLYRRSLLTTHDIWFPEGRRLDDGIFNARAYLNARRISMLSDADYYFLRGRAEGGQLSQGEKNPGAYTDSVATMAQIVREGLGHTATADEIVLELYRRKCLIQYGERFARYDPAVQDAWIAGHGDFAARFVTERMEQALRSPFRERAYFVRRRDREGLLGLQEVETSPRVTADITRAAWVAEGLDVTMTVTVHGRLSLPRQVVCALAGRDDEGSSAFPLVRDDRVAEYGEGTAYSGVLPWPSIRALAPGAYDVHLVSETPIERLKARVRWLSPAAALPAREGAVLYATKSGNAGLRKTA